MVYGPRPAASSRMWSVSTERLRPSRPTATNGSIYTPGSPIHIGGTTTLRAVAVRPGYLDSKVETHTYIFLSDVVVQSPSGQAPGPGWPTGNVNGQEIDYGMDPEIVNSSTYSALMDDALTAIPTFSLVTDLDHLFDPFRLCEIAEKQKLFPESRLVNRPEAGVTAVA